VGLVLLNELLMGATFSLAYGGGVPGGGRGGADLGATLAAVVGSSWFLFTMAAEMAVATYLLLPRVGRELAIVLGAQSALMFLSPPALGSDSTWVSVAVFGGSAGMIGLFVFLMEHAYRHPDLDGRFARYTVRLLAVYVVLMAGLYLWLADGSALLFAAAVVLEMVLFFEAVLRPGPSTADDRVNWQLRPRWAFQLLLYVFVAELFMGALLDLEANGPSFLAIVPSAALVGSPLAVLGSAASNGFWFVAVVTGSAWFLIMMGLEMGALVAFKMRETRPGELRVRLALMVGAFALFTVYLPGFWTTLPVRNLPEIAQVPLVGWGMGIGSGGPLAPGLFGAIGLTYIGVGALSALFGRRVLCSVLCNAPMMFQGTLLDGMKSFNRSSVVGRKYLGSRFSSAYTVTTAAVLVSLVGASSLSFLDSIGRADVTFAGRDPTQFLFGFYFGVLWYVMFVTIPYTGSYNCVTMGWCHWGTFSQAFSRLGFFKLKVKDREVCRQCTTLDCAKACPVGLVDMPGHFRTKGEFRSSKCCGVGGCVGACPYGNLYIHDVRHWVAGRLMARRDAREAARQLPMVGATGRRTPSLQRAAPAAAPPGARARTP
jgi:polyferredoxin